jgi:demethylmenaquinone methyltransferase / 2-methoxy-6-polyprenyl-1,4-benzoquinol methylase
VPVLDAGMAILVQFMAAQSHPRDQAVQGMFDRIAGRYDLLNRVISFKLDNWWRTQAIDILIRCQASRIVDLGTGTGDMVFNALKSTQGVPRLVGLDVSLNMLQLACAKRAAQPHGSTAAFVQGSAMASPFKNASFDGAMSAFVLRNVSDLELFFSEACRILKPGGKLITLDMFPPQKNWFAPLYCLYFYRLVPWIGGLLAGDRSAYRYLSESVRNFHSPEVISERIRRAGFAQVTLRKFLNGAVCMHIAEKTAVN